MSATAPELLRPRALRRGDLVVIASLSGPLPAMYEPNVTRTERVLEGMGFRVRRAPLLEVGRQRWWSSASPAEIAAELNGLLRDPEVRAIVASDGGQTVFGYLDLVDLDAIRADPKPVLGYSDLSLLHLALRPGSPCRRSGSTARCCSGRRSAGSPRTCGAICR